MQYFLLNCRGVAYLIQRCEERSDRVDGGGAITHREKAFILRWDVRQRQIKGIWLVSALLIAKIFSITIFQSVHNIILRRRIGLLIMAFIKIINVIVFDCFLFREHISCSSIIAFM